jgi:peptidoglycan-N-acetylmuramic acid deacetylase
MMGYKSVFWSFAYRDYDLDNQMDPSEALFQCVDQVHLGAVYLLHAVSATNTEILGDFIDSVRDEGYEFGVFPVLTAPSVE